MNRIWTSIWVWLSAVAAALIDPVRREQAVFRLLVAYCAAWSVYGAIAKGSQDVHFDMGEMVAWSRDAGIGTPKHPPVAAWLAKAWFAVFPQADWSYYVFAMVLATFALWCAWRISAQYLDGEKRLAALLLLTFIPFFNFHALKYNANTVLIPLWAIATWFFLRSYETRSVHWAALAGLGAAAAMMGKYWSIVLLGGLVVAALIDRRRVQYFMSTAPWVTIVIGCLALAPHVAWLVANDFSPFTYAVDSHLSNASSAAWSGVTFVTGAFGYAAAPIVIAAIIARPRLSPAALIDTVWPADDPRRLVLLAFILPLVLPGFAAVAFKVDIVSLWAMCAMTLLGVVLLGSPLVTVSRRAVTWVLGLAIVFPLLMVIASPVIAIVIHRQGVPNYATHYRLLAMAVDRAWRETTDKPMRFFGSYTNIVNGVSFYLKDHPSTLDIMDPRTTPWSDEASVARAGIALACPEPEAACMVKLNERAKGLPRHAATLSRRYWGEGDPPVRYVIVIVPPAK